MAVAGRPRSAQMPSRRASCERWLQGAGSESLRRVPDARRSVLGLARQRRSTTVCCSTPDAHPDGHRDGLRAKLEISGLLGLS